MNPAQLVTYCQSVVKVLRRINICFRLCWTEQRTESKKVLFWGGVGGTGLSSPDKAICYITFAARVVNLQLTKMTEVKVGFQRELRLHFCLYLALLGETEGGKERRAEYKWEGDDVTSSGWSSATVSIGSNPLHANPLGMPAPLPLLAAPPPSHLSSPETSLMHHMLRLLAISAYLFILALSP